MIWVIYNLLLHLYFIVALPFYIFKFFTSEKYRGGLKARLGFMPSQISSPQSESKSRRGGKASKEKKPRILVHTVSVGEFLAGVPLFNALGKELASYDLVVSTTTTTGNKIAGKWMENPNKVVYFPLDFNWAVNRFFDRISPDIIVLVETELWPNFLRASKKKNIPVVVVNGRVSNSSFKNYWKVKRFFGYICNNIRAWGMQFPEDVNRIKKLGINTENISLTGSLKFDSAIQRRPDREEREKIKVQWGWNPELFVLVGGSTHRGEEKILLDIYQKLKRDFIPMKPGLVLIIAPRHPERINELKALVDQYNFKYILRSEWNSDTVVSQYEVVLVDTLGELLSIYTFADVVFIGKSLKRGGGQNIIEPASLGKAVICGPFMDNFMETTKWLVENGGMIQVSDSTGLEQAIKDLLNSPKQRKELGQRAEELIKSASGATEKNMNLIKKVLNHKKQNS